MKTNVSTGTSLRRMYQISNDVLSYQHPELIERFKRKFGLSESGAHELFSDVKKYLYLVVTTGRKLAPTQAIDIGWHEFVLYTRDYAGFCNRFFGTFIHHTPNPVLKPHVVPNPVETINLAHETFGTLGKNWHRVDATACSADCAPDSECHGDDSCGGDV